MLFVSSPTKRHFTEAARAAALAARRRKQQHKVDPNRPEVFVVRGVEDARLYEWEIRRFGGILLQASSARFETRQAAQSAGALALEAFEFAA